MNDEREPSRCPFCGARGVKCFAPLTVDTVQVDVPYCGHCGKNYPRPRGLRDNILRLDDHR